MKDKVFMLIVGVLIGAIITAAGFVIFGNKGQKEFDPEKFNDGNRPGFSRDRNEIDFNNIDVNNIPEMPNDQAQQ